MWHAKPPEAAAKELNVDVSSGLSESEAQVRMQKYGPNRLSERKKKTALQLFFSQLKSPLIYILMAAALIAALLGETTDTIIIACVILLNALIGVIQESKAEKALEALKKLSTPNAVVIREGKQSAVSTEELVPGDIVILETGRIVPCDLRLVESVNLKIEESALTGESVPVEKDATRLLAETQTVLGDRVNMAFSSTIVTYGRGRGIAVGTGMRTEIGRIAEMIEEEKEEQTPLQRKLAVFGKRLGVIILALCAVMFFISLLRPLFSSGSIESARLVEFFLTAVSLAVAAIPEGLPAMVTIVLALGVQKMVRKNAIIRKLPAVETLGSVNVICTDKTGTLTQNRMTVLRFFADGAAGDVSTLDTKNSVHRLLLENLVLCNDATYMDGTQTGDPTEIALLEAGRTRGITNEETERAHPRVMEIPFDSQRKLMSTMHAYGSEYRLMTKGALDTLLGLCTSVHENGRVVTLTDEKKKVITARADDMSKQALRVLGAACKKIGQKNPPPEGLEQDLEFVGFVGMMDPPRLEVKDSIARCRRAGIKTVMITGDHRNTACAIAKELGIATDPSEAITGKELNMLSDEDLKTRVRTLRVFARVSPEHKVRIIKALKAGGSIVSMTGDGVNDAPSLQAADIGVAMGITGTDVAKGASDMVLTDDNFTTIVSAIEKGRNIYNNIKKSILFLLSCNAGEIICIFFSILIGWPVLLIPIHILWVNLITDTLPALSLGMDPDDPDVLKLHPRDPDETLFAGGGSVSVVGNGILIAALTLTAFRVGLGTDQASLVHARTMAFAVLSLSQLIHAFNMRHQTKSIAQTGFLSNPALIGACVFGAALQVMVISVPAMARVFKVKSLHGSEWALVWGLALFPLVCNEAVKAVRRKRMRMHAVTGEKNLHE